MNKYLLLFILKFAFLFSCFEINAVQFISKNQEAEKVFASLQKLPEFQTLIEEAEKEGPIKIEVVFMEYETFDAFWDSCRRVISINQAKNQNFNVLMCSILFEIHNARSDKEFKVLYGMAKKGQITKEMYVERVERMEHKNALNCSYLIQKGIEKGLFSKKAAWPIYQNFDDHYKLQQLTKHSHWLANNYEKMAPRNLSEIPYKGTLPTLSSSGREDVLRYLKIKKDLESLSETTNAKAYAALQKECNNLENCYFGNNGQNCNRAKEQLELLEVVFEKNETYHKMIKSSPLYLVKIKD